MKLDKSDFVYLDDSNFVVQSSDGDPEYWSKEIMKKILRDQKVVERVLILRDKVNEIGWDEADISPDVFKMILK